MLFDISIEDAANDRFSEIFSFFRREVFQEVVFWFSQELKTSGSVEIL